jgi:hypothetical protein
VYKVYITKKMTTKKINFGNNNESGSLEISRALVMNLSINNENKEINDKINNRNRLFIFDFCSIVNAIKKNINAKIIAI